MLRLNSAYMLRNDGKLVECSAFHPYIKYENRGSVEKSIYDLFTWMPQNILWFFKNTNDKDLKQLIQTWVKSIDTSADYNIKVSNKLKDDLNLASIDKIINNKHDIEMYFLHINNQCNQEFLRIRTSGKT